jgi:ATP-dependent Clp protease ATP-binding subunit ClpA
MGSIVAGTKYRGEFEERMKKIVDELKSTDDVILYIDDKGKIFSVRRINICSGGSR